MIAAPIISLKCGWPPLYPVPAGLEQKQGDLDPETPWPSCFLWGSANGRQQRRTGGQEETESGPFSLHSLHAGQWSGMAVFLNPKASSCQPLPGLPLSSVPEKLPPLQLQA